MPYPDVPEEQQCWADLNYWKPATNWENKACDQLADTPIGLCARHAAEVLGTDLQEATQ